MKKTGPGKAETDLMPPFEGLALNDIIIPDTKDAVSAAVAPHCS